MTTLAWDGRILAADTRYTQGGCLYGYCRKIQLLNNGQVLAVSGELGYAKMLRDCLENNKPITEFLEKKELKKFGALLLDVENNLWYFDDSYRGFVSVDEHLTAEGSGNEIALAFLRQGYTAKNAIRAVSKVHVSTNNIIDTYDSETKELVLAEFPKGT